MRKSLYCLLVAVVISFSGCAGVKGIYGVKCAYNPGSFGCPTKEEMEKEIAKSYQKKCLKLVVLDRHYKEEIMGWPEQVVKTEYATMDFSDENRQLYFYSGKNREKYEGYQAGKLYEVEASLEFHQINDIPKLPMECKK